MRPPTQAVVDYKTQRQRELLNQEDTLARRRDDDNRAKTLEDERVKQALRRAAEDDIQTERRRTDEHRARLERENMKARALAEADGRIKEQRDNEDVFARQTRLRLEQVCVRGEKRLFVSVYSKLFAWDLMESYQLGMLRQL